MTRIIENGVHVGPRPKHRPAKPASAAPAPAAPPVVAPGPEVSVNGQVIPRAEIEAEAQNHPAPNPGAALEEAARALAVRALLVQEAQRLEIAPRPEAIGAGRTETADDAAIRQLLEAEVQVPVADDAARRRYYANNAKRFASPTLYEARHILLAAPEEDEAARRAAAEKAAALLETLGRAPDQFATLAKAWSRCPSAAQGGSLGQLDKGQTVPEFEAVLFRMEAGQLWPEPVATRYGLHIVMLDRIIAGRQLPFDMVRERIAAYLEAASWSRAVAQYLSILAGAADIRGVALDGAESPLVQ